MKRRRFLKSMAGLAGTGALAGAYAWKVEPYWLEFVRMKMPVGNLPRELDGKMLMQISDVHVGNFFDWNFIIDSFKKARALQPDLVVYTGDYVSYQSELQLEQLETVFEHAVKGKLGTLAVLGNHDYGHNWGHPEVAVSVTDILEQSGVEVLRNAAKTVAGMNFIGIDDLWGTNFNPQEATARYSKGEPSVALCHNPDVCDMDVWNGFEGWILSGHTHGGQCKPPFLPPPVLPVKNRSYAAGKIELEDGRTLYVNRALGNMFPVRFNVRPEITVFELCRG